MERDSVHVLSGKVYEEFLKEAWSELYFFVPHLLEFP